VVIARVFVVSPASLLSLVCLLCFLITPLPPRSTLFPYTTLFRSRAPASCMPRQFLKDWLTKFLVGNTVKVLSKFCTVTVCKAIRSEEHTSELQSRFDLVCRLLLEKKKRKRSNTYARDRYQKREQS